MNIYTDYIKLIYTVCWLNNNHQYTVQYMPNIWYNTASQYNLLYKLTIKTKYTIHPAA